MQLWYKCYIYSKRQLFRFEVIFNNTVTYLLAQIPNYSTLFMVHRQKKIILILLNNSCTLTILYSNVVFFHLQYLYSYLSNLYFQV